MRKREKMYAILSDELRQQTVFATTNLFDLNGYGSRSRRRSKSKDK